MRDIPNVNAKVTDDYEIYSNRTGKIINQYNDKDGYKICTIDRKSYRVHRLIASAYYGESKLFVNHKNGIKYDNRPENLEWVTIRENNIHAIRTGLFDMKKQQEANERRKKFTDDEINYIRGSFGDSENYGTLSRKFKVSRGVIWQIVNHKTYKGVIPI